MKSVKTLILFKMLVCYGARSVNGFTQAHRWLRLNTLGARAYHGPAFVNYPTHFLTKNGANRPEKRLYSSSTSKVGSEIIGLVTKIPNQQSYFNLYEEKGANTKHVVQFTAEWCSACQALEKEGSLANLQNRNPLVRWHTVDIDEVQDLSMALKISQVPTFIYIENGEERRRFVGGGPELSSQLEASILGTANPGPASGSTSTSTGACCAPTTAEGSTAAAAGAATASSKNVCVPAYAKASGAEGSAGSSCCPPTSGSSSSTGSTSGSTSTLSKSSSQEKVSEYYGQDLSSSADLTTTACMTSLEETSDVRKCLANVHPTVKDKFYGCGSPLPPLLAGATVLDLGCGTGRDCYVASQLVGPEGRVIGVDMTTEQLAVAVEYEEYHREQFGYGVKNTEFHHGLIEKLGETRLIGASSGGSGSGSTPTTTSTPSHIPTDTVDVVISNCVLNLSPHKSSVFGEIWRVLRPGGELYFSDVVSDRRLPAAARADKEALGECLGGCVYMGDMVGMMAKAGFTDVRVVTHRQVEVGDERLNRLLGGALFYSVTVRAFKLPSVSHPTLSLSSSSSSTSAFSSSSSSSSGSGNGSGSACKPSNSSGDKCCPPSSEGATAATADAGADAPFEVEFVASPSADSDNDKDGDRAREESSGGGVVELSFESEAEAQPETVTKTGAGAAAEAEAEVELYDNPNLLEPSREDYGQVATYLGGASGGEGMDDHVFYLEGSKSFPLVPKYGTVASGGGNVNRPQLVYPFVRGVPTPVDKNTAIILRSTRYASAFAVTPPLAHQGPFTDGGYFMPKPNYVPGQDSGGSCC